MDKHLVEAMDVQADSLSPVASKALQALAQICTTLEIDSEGAPEAWAVAAVDQWAKAEQRLSEETKALDKVRLQVADIFSVKKALERELAISADATLATEYLALKSEVEALEERLKSLQPDWPVASECSHEALISLADELSQAEAELRDLEERTSLCGDLPPHSELAKLRLEEAQQELFLLEEEWTRRVTSMWSG